MDFLKIYARVLAALGRARPLALALAAGNMAVAGLLFIEPLLFGQVIQVLAGGAGEMGGLLAVWVGVGVLSIGGSLLTALGTERMAHRHRLLAMRGFYEHVLGLPPAFHGEAHSGRLMKVLLSGADTMFWLWLGFFRDQLVAYVAILVLLPLTLLLNWRLGLVLIGLVAVVACLVFTVVRRTEAGQARAQRHQVHLVGMAQDALANVVVVQSFGGRGAEARRFGAIMEEVIRHQFPVLTWWAAASVMTRGASTAAVIAMVVVGAGLVGRGEATVGEVVAFMGFATLLVGRLDGAVAFASRLFQELPTLREFFAVLDAESVVPDGPGVLPAGAGEVVFEQVGFAYPAGGRVLEEVSFTAKAGSVVALVGATGAGKSTCMALLERFWDPDRGRILVDGRDIRDVTLESLRSRIGVVFQDAMLFNRTIRENLLVGRPDADQAAIEAACRAAEAHDFILAQPEGYETMVGERGATLSGGQRQRLAIARALLKDPPILILDEATSALDAATEARVVAALRRLMAGRTSFVIAHRLSTVRDADEILVFADGRVVERGDFATLVAAKGRFAELVATQLEG